MLFSKSYIRISLYYNFIILFDKHIILNSESHHHFIYKHFFFQTRLPVFTSSYHKIRDHKIHRQNNILITTLTTFIVNYLIHINHPSHENPYLCPAKTGITTHQGRMSYASRSSRFASGACEIRQSSTKAVSPSTLFIYTLQNY